MEPCFQRAGLSWTPHSPLINRFCGPPSRRAGEQLSEGAFETSVTLGQKSRGTWRWLCVRFESASLLDAKARNLAAPASPKIKSITSKYR
jgi:hypothetical protein